ncbi:hypothetical protein [Aliikangiella maris]|uniref:Uncharacterized protein n=2 Tax=Aliikangiella maris TaxID=3162458 RepID=A0ABV2BVS3_9GAMM
MLNWPKDDNILSWDPENMEAYWKLCEQYDQYPQLIEFFEATSSQQEFNFDYID